MRATHRDAVLTSARIRRLRWQFGKTALLYITDRCPVGCAHCSVDSMARSPSIRSWDLFGEIVKGLAEARDLQAVGISGGEPFVERRGLTLAARELHASGKHVVVYTSGVWARDRPIPWWIHEVLSICSSVFLSTDQYHQQRISDDTFVAAARTIVKCGAHLVVPTIKSSVEKKKVRSLLRIALGHDWKDRAEIEWNPPLAYGRGANVFGKPAPRAATSFDRCDLVTSPTIRYDGHIVPCCNEEVVRGAGPERLHGLIDVAKDVTRVMERFADDNLFQLMSSVGLGPLTLLPHFADLERRQFRTICELCWAMQDCQAAAGNSENRILAALAAITPHELPANVSRIV